jgi:hypothetical protein
MTNCPPLSKEIDMQISPKEFEVFTHDFFVKGYHEYERFGQSFCNEFEVGVDADIFYEESVSEAIETISNKYIDWTRS